MKNLKIVLIAIVLATAFTSCKFSSQKAESSKENVTQAQKDFKKEVENFKKVANEKIAANEKVIADWKVNLTNSKRGAKASIEKKISDLEKKSLLLKTKLNDYKDESLDSWESFKTEFNQDMDELGNALKALTTNE